MSRKLPPLDFDDLYRRYQAGETGKQIAVSVGIGETTLMRQFGKRGLPRRHSGTERKHPGFAAINGLSAPEIAARFGVNPATARRWLRAVGQQPNRSEAMRLRLARLGANGRASLVSAAHAAVRGRPKSFDDLCRKAIGRERAGSHISPNDRALADMLTQRGLTVTLGKAVGPYNVDIAAGAVAVEVFGGAWHGGGRAAARWPQRIRYLLDTGWSVVVIWVEQATYPLTVEAADYVVSLCQVTGSDPSARRQYRVIRGTGQEIVRGCAQDDHFPVKPPRERRIHVRCDHERVAD